MRHRARVGLVVLSCGIAGGASAGAPVPSAGQWPQFRGTHARGVADGAQLPDSWDGRGSDGILWKTRIPGLAHSSPVVWGEQVFVTTAISSRADATFKPGLYGEGTASEDVSEQKWELLSLDRRTGKILWERTAYAGVPQGEAPHQGHLRQRDAGHRRHDYVVAFFGSQGIYAYDLAGNLKWKRDLGRLDAGSLRRPELRVGHRQLADPVPGPGDRAVRPAEGFVPDRAQAQGRGGGVEDLARRASLVGHADRVPRRRQGRTRAGHERAEVHPRLRPEDRPRAVAAGQELQHHRARRRSSTAS